MVERISSYVFFLGGDEGKEEEDGKEEEGKGGEVNCLGDGETREIVLYVDSIIKETIFFCLKETVVSKKNYQTTI